MRTLILALLAAGAATVAAAQDPQHPQHPPPEPPQAGEATEAPPPETGPPTEAAHGHAAEMVAPILGIPHAREGSGTSWLPDAAPMHARHGMRRGWQTMLHGNLFVHYLDEGSERGDEDFGSSNWLMGMARRRLGEGELGLRAMLSLEPATLGDCGYPVLLTTGETCEGQPLHDRQHPHDLFMELAALYRREVAPGLGAETYAALAGEPALGPTAFPHRPSALPNPIAPISHHWLDSTHISFGVVTAGLFGRRWKAEGSLFNGREPDEERWDLDLDTLDSWSGRLWWLPDDRWALQLSAGHLEEAEAGEAGGPRIDVRRFTASAAYQRPLGGARQLAATGGWGRNEEGDEVTDAVLAEASLDLDARHTLFGRAERVEKTGHDLALPDHALEGRVFAVTTAMVGWALQGRPRHGWRPGVGAKASVNLLPRDLEAFYGTRTATGWGVFASLRPAAHGERAGHADHPPRRW